MLVKELRGVWWKILMAAVPVFVIPPLFLPPYVSEARTMETFTDEIARGQILSVYGAGGIVMIFLAAFLGTALPLLAALWLFERKKF